MAAVTATTRASNREASGGKGSSGSGAGYDEGVRDGRNQGIKEEMASRGSGGGSGPKVLKKGADGHGGGKKRRRY